MTIVKAKPIDDTVSSAEYNARSEVLRAALQTLRLLPDYYDTAAHFEMTGLSSVTIPDSVISIERAAFFGNKQLTNVIIGKNIKSIGDSALIYQGLLFIGSQRAAEIYAAVWKTYLEPSFAALNAGNNWQANNIYRQMVLDLKKTYLA